MRSTGETRCDDEYCEHDALIALAAELSSQTRNRGVKNRSQIGSIEPFELTPPIPVHACGAVSYTAAQDGAANRWALVPKGTARPAEVGGRSGRRS